MNMVRFLIVCSALALLVACGGKKSAMPDGTSAAGRMSEDETLLMTIGMSPVALGAGENLHAFLSVTNISDAAKTLVFPSGKTFDLEILDASDNVAFRWSDGQSFTMAVRNVTLQPGERIAETLSVTFPPVGATLDAGTYRARAVLDADVRMSTFPLGVIYNP